VTDVEDISTAPSGKRKRSWLRATALAGVVVTALICTGLTSARPAGAATLAGEEAQATAINNQLQADAQKVDALSQTYDGALQTLQSVNASLAKTRTAIAVDKQQVGVDRQDLRRDAINAYVSDGDDTGLQNLFGGTGDTAVVTDEYRSVASQNITGAVDTLNTAQGRLTSEQSRLETSQSEANAALTSASASRQAAQATVAAQEQTLAQVKGQIATLVAAQQAAEQAAQYAAFKKRVAATTAPARTPTASAPGAPVPAPPVVAASGGAAQAVAAAESQIGVPYHWGGESPGVGFDCSGLTQWAWGRAGVSIPRTAQAQYAAIEHVSLAALEPGDLLFWGSGAGDITHVAMYVGGGQVVHAPETGELVRIQSIWNNGLVGAGRP
jgi:cell wall-associated NlpC family hydrolase